VKTLLGLAILFTCDLYAEDPRIAALVTRADAEERQHRIRPALVALRAAEQIEPDNVGVLLRLSKQYSDLISQTAPPQAAKMIAERSLEYARKAAAIDPRNAKARLSLAVAYGKLTDLVGNRTRLEYSRIVKEEALTALRLDPTDDYAWHVLGRWHFAVANVNGPTRALAKLIYGGLPVASNEEAIRHFKKAVELAPRRIVHHHELARVYQTMGREDLASECWEAIVAQPADGPEDEKTKAEARQALEAGAKREKSKARAAVGR
jgi:tetratricopeptide (TPR) repeat protein